MMKAGWEDNRGKGKCCKYCKYCSVINMMCIHKNSKEL